MRYLSAVGTVAKGRDLYLWEPVGKQQGDRTGSRFRGEEGGKMGGEVQSQCRRRRGNHGKRPFLGVLGGFVLFRPNASKYLRGVRFPPRAAPAGLLLLSEFFRVRFCLKEVSTLRANRIGGLKSGLAIWERSGGEGGRESRHHQDAGDGDGVCACL